MKKILFIFSLLFLAACNDGNFDVPAFEFEETVKQCGTNVFYRLNSESTEAMILELPSTNFGTIEGDNELSISGTNTITYRIFNEGIDTNYFCQDIPPATPKVIKELVAESGFFLITTIVDATTTPATYSYDIVLKEVLFIDGDEQIYFETFNFGTDLIVN
jgi:hypothetical protein